MTKLDYEEIIGLSEDPDVTLGNVHGEAPAPEDCERVARVADTISVRVLSKPRSE